MKHVARIASHQHGLLGFFGHGFHLPITDNECPDYRGINGWPAMRGRLRENFAAGGNALIQCRHGMGHSRIPSAKPRLFTTNNAIGNTNAGNASHAAAEDEEALRHSQALVRRARWIVLGLVILAVVYWAGSCIVDPTCK